MKKKFAQIAVSVAFACLAAGVHRAQGQTVALAEKMGESAGGATASVVPALPVRPDSVFARPEVPPRFVGGEGALLVYLAQNLQFPAQAERERVMGKVLVRFVLSADGRVTEAAVVRGPGYGLNEEALRLVAQMPRWVPGQQAGRPVRVACTLPVDFLAIR